MPICSETPNWRISLVPATYGPFTVLPAALHHSSSARQSVQNVPGTHAWLERMRPPLTSTQHGPPTPPGWANTAARRRTARHRNRDQRSPPTAPDYGVNGTMLASAAIPVVLGSRSAQKPPQLPQPPLMSSCAEARRAALSPRMRCHQLTCRPRSPRGQRTSGKRQSSAT
jgi:hypothetical protein